MPLVHSSPTGAKEFGFDNEVTERIELAPEAGLVLTSHEEK